MRRLLSALGCIAALLIFATSASAASTGMYVGIGGTYAMQDFDTGDLDSLRQYGFDPKYDELHQVPNFIKQTDKYIEKFPIARTWIQKRYIPKGCVGFAAISLLERGMDVCFSNLTTPDTISDI